MAKEESDWTGMFPEALEAAGRPRYLGDYKVVGALLRTYANGILSREYADGDAASADVEKQARALARVFLGQDPQYAGTKWNSPGNIDAWLAVERSKLSTDPEERVAGVLMNLIQELWQLTQQVIDQKLISEQWTGAADEIMERYAGYMLGISDRPPRPVRATEPKLPPVPQTSGPAKAQAMQEMLALAEAGDLEGLKAHPGAPSGDGSGKQSWIVSKYRQQLLAALASAP